MITEKSKSDTKTKLKSFNKKCISELIKNHNLPKK